MLYGLEICFSSALTLEWTHYSDLNGWHARTIQTQLGLVVMSGSVDFKNKSTRNAVVTLFNLSIQLIPYDSTREKSRNSLSLTLLFKINMSFNKPHANTHTPIMKKSHASFSPPLK